MPSFLTALLKKHQGARYLILIFLLALAIRLLIVPVTTELLIKSEKLPSYYFSDSFTYHRVASNFETDPDLYQRWLAFSPPKAAYMRVSAFFNSIFGPSYSVMMSVNAIISAAMVFIVFLLANELFDRRTGLLAALLYCVFPSAAFWGAQHMRDTLVMAFNLLALLSIIFILKGRKPVHSSLMFIVALTGATVFRPQLCLVMFAAFTLFIAYCLFSRKTLNALKSLGVAAATALTYWSVTSFMTTLTSKVFSAVPNPLYRSLPSDSLSSLPMIENLMRSRYVRLTMHLDGERAINTLLFPEWWPSSLFEMAFMELKLIFYVLFMPLPLLFPTDGNLGRIAALLENSVFFVLCTFALYGIFKVIKNRSQDIASMIFIIIYLAVFVGLYAFYAPDLGSAMRYKLQFIPLFSIFISKGVLSAWKR